MLPGLQQLIDLRKGEGRVAIGALVTLLLLICAHTLMETARDALFLEALPPSRLTLVYIALAGLAFVATAWNVRSARNFGRRNSLVASLLMASGGTVVFYLLPHNKPVVIALYLWSGLLGMVLIVQFWMLAGRVFTVQQGKRLFGPITAGGVLGAVLGATTAVALLEYFPVDSLLLSAAGVMMLTGALLTTVPMDGEQAPPKALRPAAESTRSGLSSLRDETYLGRLALMLALATAAGVLTDYMFKSVAAQTIAPDQLGAFFARYYAGVNTVALVIQVVGASYVVRRIGVLSATFVVPTTLLAGALATLLSGGRLAGVLLTKGADGVLRHSLHRVSVELLWMPVPRNLRERNKSLIDTLASRGTQAIVAVLLLGLAAMGWDSPLVLAGGIVVLTLAWLVAAARLRRPYLDLFRTSISRASFDADAEVDLDLDSVGLLLRSLSSEDPERALAALDLLAARGRTGLIPSLVLLHSVDEVVVRALELITTSDRDDWVVPAGRLIDHRSQPVRIAAMRAIGRGSDLSAIEARLTDDSASVRANAAFLLVDRDALRAQESGVTFDVLADRRVAAQLEEGGECGAQIQLALLDAIGRQGGPHWIPTLLSLGESSLQSPDAAVSFAVAANRLHHPDLIPTLISMLVLRDGRGFVRSALVAHGDDALDALEQTLADPQRDHRVRLHIPNTLARFGSQRAVDLITTQLESGATGLIRFKALRALSTAASQPGVVVDQTRIIDLLRRNLREYYRILSLHVALQDQAGTSSTDASDSGDLLRGLLRDKLHQAVDRSFRLLAIAHPREDVWDAWFAIRGQDARLRANASEYLSNMTLGREYAGASAAGVRDMMLLLVDSLDPAQRLARAGRFIDKATQDYDDALRLLLEEPDEVTVSIAAYHAMALGEGGVSPAVLATSRRIRQEVRGV